jgi:antibiotic biosynthesis monooxygenase (ABM) superfamily enzyme
MSVTVRATATKPTGVQWYSLLSPENLQSQREENAWTAQQPGFISRESVIVSEEVSTLTVTFDTIEQYRAWKSARDSSPYGLARSEYSTVNNIISTYSYL